MLFRSCVEIPSEQPETAIMKFVCRDTGIGMAEEFQKHIFEPFAQEHEGSRTKFAGTGLGMAISRKLVEKMGGTITFESEKGVGTTFVIRVPFKIDMNADKREKQKDVSEKSIKGLHILLAEDNELNMEIAEFMFQNEGAEVTKAWNGLCRAFQRCDFVANIRNISGFVSLAAIGNQIGRASCRERV